MEELRPAKCGVPFEQCDCVSMIRTTRRWQKSLKSQGHPGRLKTSCSTMCPTEQFVVELPLLHHTWHACYYVCTLANFVFNAFRASVNVVEYAALTRLNTLSNQLVEKKKTISKTQVRSILEHRYVRIRYTIESRQMRCDAREASLQNTVSGTPSEKQTSPH